MRSAWAFWLLVLAGCSVLFGGAAEARSIRIDLPTLCGGLGGNTGSPPTPTAPYNASDNLFYPGYDPSHVKGFDFDPGVGNATINRCFPGSAPRGNADFGYYSGIAYGWTQTTTVGGTSTTTVLAQAIAYLAAYYVYTPCTGAFGPTYCALGRANDPSFPSGAEEVELNYLTNSSGQCPAQSNVYLVWGGNTYAHSPSGICGERNDFVFYGGCCDNPPSPYGSLSTDGQYFGYVNPDACQPSCTAFNWVTLTTLPPGWYPIPNVGPATVAVNSSTVVPGGTAILSVIPGGSGPYSYQWYVGSSGNTSSPVSGGTGPSLTTSALQSPSNYWVAVTGANGTFNSATTGIDVYSTPALINAFAGNGVSGFSGDSGAATAASLSSPYGVAVDANGNLYVADSGNRRVRKIDTSGRISTVAGNGSSGIGGDGGPATAANLANPTGVAIDPVGNLYIADAGTGRVRMVNTSGIITTVAGGGSGLGDGGPATSAVLYQPSGVAVDGAGNLYIADQGESRIRMVNAIGIITTIAGTGTAGFAGDGGAATSANLCNPYGVAVDMAQNIYVADTCNNRIRKFSVGSTISTIAGNGGTTYAGDGGPATAASLGQPVGVTVDLFGNVYIADRAIADRVRKINPSQVITTLAGNGNFTYAGDGGPAASASLFFPVGVAVDSRLNVYVGDSSNNRVRVISSSPTITQSATTVSSGGNATLSVTVSSSGSFTYQWYVGSSGDTSHPISGANQASFTTPALNATATYWVLVTGSSGTTLSSPTITVTVNSGSGSQADAPIPWWAVGLLAVGLLGLGARRTDRAAH